MNWVGKDSLNRASEIERQLVRGRVLFLSCSPRKLTGAPRWGSFGLMYSWRLNRRMYLTRAACV